MQQTYRRIVLTSRPSGLPGAENFALEECAVPEVGPGRFLVQNEFLGLAPVARLRMNAGGAYAAPIALGDVVYGQSMGRVLQSRHAEFPEGCRVVLMAGGWQEMSLSDGTGAMRLPDGALPPRLWLGALGVSGLTAYAGLVGVGELRASDRVVISAASGAVGALAGQIAKAMGCHVTSITSGPDKCRHLTGTLGFDAAVDGTSADFDAALAEACTGGCDLYFDNVGGRIRARMLDQMATFGRVVVCGMISEYSDAGAERASWMPILNRQLTVRGFLVNAQDHLRDEFTRQMTAWIDDGRIQLREDISDGLEAAPGAFARMLSGRTFGKTLVRL